MPSGAGSVSYSITSRSASARSTISRLRSPILPGARIRNREVGFIFRSFNLNLLISSPLERPLCYDRSSQRSKARISLWWSQRFPRHPTANRKS